jgi:Rad3-related DNA helicase
VTADSIDYRQHKNEYKEYEFLYKAREKLNYSNIIIINHSLLFSDLKSETSFLGDVQHLILDEAHSLDDSLTESLTKGVNFKHINDVFVYIESVFHKKEIKKIAFLREKENLISKLHLIFDYSYSYILQKTGQSEYKNILLTQDFFNQMDFSDLRKKIIIDFLFIIDMLSTIQEVDFSKEVAILNDFMNLFSIILDKNSDKEYIKILQCNDQMLVTIQYTLLNPGNYLDSNLWSKLKSVILTSATLKIGNNFDYIKKIF